MHTQILQDSVARDLRHGDRLLQLLLQFVCECNSKRIIETGPHLLK